MSQLWALAILLGVLSLSINKASLLQIFLSFEIIILGLILSLVLLPTSETHSYYVVLIMIICVISAVEVGIGLVSLIVIFKIGSQISLSSVALSR